MAEPKQQALTVKQVAALLDRSVRWVQDRKKEGFISTVTKRGGYTVANVVRGGLAYYEDALSKASKTDASRNASNARTREIELRIAQKSGSLIPATDAADVVADMAAFVMTEINSLPARITRDLDLRQKVQTEVDGVLDRIRNRAQTRGQSLRSGRVDLDAGGEDDTG